MSIILKQNKGPKSKTKELLKIESSIFTIYNQYMILVRIIKVRKFDDVKQTENETHMFQLFLSKREAPVLKVQLPSSRFFLKSPVLRLS